MRAVAWAFAVVLAAGCSRATTEVRVEVIGPTGPAAPASVAINVFDALGLLGHADIAPAVLPGAITVVGLPDSTEELRVVGIGVSQTGVQTLGGARVTVQPHARADASIVLSANVIDSDGDQVPDTLDDCPSLADPNQDAPCPAPGDLGGGGEADLSNVPPGSDLRRRRPTWRRPRPTAPAPASPSATASRAASSIRTGTT